MPRARSVAVAVLGLSLVHCGGNLPAGAGGFGGLVRGSGGAGGFGGFGAPGGFNPNPSIS